MLFAAPIELVTDWTGEFSFDAAEPPDDLEGIPDDEIEIPVDPSRTTSLLDWPDTTEFPGPDLYPTDP